MRTDLQIIYVSNDGDDTNDGLTQMTAVKSWARTVKLCRGNQLIFPMEDDTLARLTAEIEEKAKSR